MTDEELRLHLLATHHQWHPNKNADAWVSSACYLLRKLALEHRVEEDTDIIVRDGLLYSRAEDGSVKPLLTVAS